MLYCCGSLIKSVVLSRWRTRQARAAVLLAFALTTSETNVDTRYSRYNASRCGLTGVHNVL